MLGKALDVCPGAEARVDPRVGDRCKSAISRRGKGRQDVDSREEAVQGSSQEVIQGREVASQRIGVCHQLGRDSHSVPLSGRRHVKSVGQARTNGGGQQGSAGVADATHSVVDVAETDLIRVISEGQFSTGSAVTKAA
jgi:hypothetical protein